MKRLKKIHWIKIVKRGFSFFCVVLAIWLLCITCDWRGACSNLGESSAFISALLQSELGNVTLNENDQWSQLNRWQKLALSQSALFLPTHSAPSPSMPPTPSETVQGNEEEPVPQISAAPDGIKPHTILASNQPGCVEVCGIDLFNYTTSPLDLQAISAAQINVNLEQNGPQILIMHTHGSEAYTMDGSDQYEQSDSWRTTDNHYNVVRVGDEMQRVFEAMGLQVVHDRSLYDYPQYNGAYTRSADGIKQWLEKYPTIQVVLDVHRDALAHADGTILKPLTEIQGEKTAQVLIIVGTNDLGQNHPYWTQNLALATEIQKQMDIQWPTLARPITLHSSQFNQQLTRGSLLIEVGSHGNTLQEALQAARLFAKAAGDALLGLS